MCTLRSEEDFDYSSGVPSYHSTLSWYLEKGLSLNLEVSWQWVPGILLSLAPTLLGLQAQAATSVWVLGVKLMYTWLQRKCFLPTELSSQPQIILFNEIVKHSRMKYGISSHFEISGAENWIPNLVNASQTLTSLFEVWIYFIFRYLQSRNIPIFYFSWMLRLSFIKFHCNNSVKLIKFIEKMLNIWILTLMQPLHDFPL